MRSGNLEARQGPPSRQNAFRRSVTQVEPSIPQLQFPPQFDRTGASIWVRGRGSRPAKALPARCFPGLPRLAMSRKWVRWKEAEKSLLSASILDDLSKRDR